MATVMGDGEDVMTPGNAVNGVQMNQDHGGNHVSVSAGCACSRSRQLRRTASRGRYPRAAVDNPLVFEPRVNRMAVQPRSPPPPPPARDINPFQMRFLFEKQLQNSDINAAGRIVLPKKPCETHLPPLIINDGLWMHLEDMDFQQVWTFKFRYWSNKHGRMYIFGNTREFIRRHCLEVGDYIMVYKDDFAGSYLVQARKKGNHVSVNESTLANSGNFPGTLEEFLHYGINYRKNMWEAGASDYAHLVSTPSFEPLDFAPMD